MSLFKMFGGGSGGRSKSDKPDTPSRDHASDAAQKRAPAAEGGQEALDPDEAEARAAAAQLDLPFRSGKKSRNLSISRSGRHRYRNNKRASVVTGEVFTSADAGTGNGTGNGTGSPAATAAAANYCRDSKASHGAMVQTHTPMARTPTAV